MMSESIIESLRCSVKQTLYYYSPVITIFGLFFASTTLPSYQEQRGLILLMINYVISYVTLNLMIHTMTGKPFSMFQPMVLLPAVPLVAYHYIGVSPETERLLPMVITVFTWFAFMFKMGILSKQWCDYKDKYFWVIKQEVAADAKKSN